MGRELIASVPSSVTWPRPAHHLRQNSEFSTQVVMYKSACRAKPCGGRSGKQIRAARPRSCAILNLGCLGGGLL
jgi:hypothetical protein